jgi:hypothetical protein
MRNNQAILSIMHLRNGNDPASDGNRVLLAWLHELTSSEGMNLLSKVANDCKSESSGARCKLMRKNYYKYKRRHRWQGSLGDAKTLQELIQDQNNKKQKHRSQGDHALLSLRRTQCHEKQ